MDTSSASFPLVFSDAVPGLGAYRAMAGVGKACNRGRSFAVERENLNGLHPRRDMAWVTAPRRAEEAVEAFGADDSRVRTVSHGAGRIVRPGHPSTFRRQSRPITFLGSPCSPFPSPLLFQTHLLASVSVMLFSSRVYFSPSVSPFLVRCHRFVWFRRSLHPIRCRFCSP